MITFVCFDSVQHALQQRNEVPSHQGEKPIRPRPGLVSRLRTCWNDSCRGSAFVLTETEPRCPLFQQMVSPIRIGTVTHDINCYRSKIQSLQSSRTRTLYSTSHSRSLHHPQVADRAHVYERRHEPYGLELKVSSIPWAILIMGGYSSVLGTL